jgi:L-alanine-DL-glutamate epimerase-like enolase superfamily enzyme
VENCGIKIRRNFRVKVPAAIRHRSIRFAAAGNLRQLTPFEIQTPCRGSLKTSSRAGGSSDLKVIATNSGGPPIDSLSAEAYRIPTDCPEADGTYSWDATTLVVVNLEAGGETGLGFTYADTAVVSLIQGPLKKALQHRDGFDIPGCWVAMQRSVRNLGRAGLAACAISAIDIALWDLKARALGLPLSTLLGRCRDRVPIYGSGGFTSYSDEQLREQLTGWVHRDGCRAVKMKIGSDPARDPQRIDAAKSAIGDCKLFVDGNGAFSVKQALRVAKACRDADIRWFEEPVTSDDLAGLRLMRDRAPDCMEIAAGEYIYTLDDARQMLAADCVDVLQADVTRCGGVTGFLHVGALCEAHHIDLSGHCAPSLHRHVSCAVPRLRHLEWFHDHVRIEQMLFDGAPTAREGTIEPDPGRPGHGLTFKKKDGERFHINGGVQ